MNKINESEELEGTMEQKTSSRRCQGGERYVGDAPNRLGIHHVSVRVRHRPTLAGATGGSPSQEY